MEKTSTFAVTHGRNGHYKSRSPVVSHSYKCHTMDFRTIVSLPETDVRITPRTRIMTLGSCFAEHIGRRLQRCLPEDCLSINPTGVLYNSGSIYNALSALAQSGNDEAGALVFEAADGMWHHWQHSTKFVARSREELVAMSGEGRAEARRVFRAIDVLFITFSTDHAYYLAEGPLKGTLVANCHKQPARMFYEAVIDPDEAFAQWHPLLHALHRARPELRIVFTLSPYRYAKYGMHENALSKARQMLLIDRLCHACDGVSYFPAYEIITDELRDYRFYESDMLHPSQQAVDYVWERFMQWAFTDEMKIYARERGQIMRDMEHRPLNPDSPEHRAFKTKADERRRLFNKKWGEAL